MSKKIKLITKLTIYPKLVLSFLLVIVPIYAISLTMNESGADSVRNEILQSMQSRVHFYLSSFEIDMNRVLKLKKEYVADEDLQNLSNIAPIMTDYDRRRAVLHLQNKLMLLKNSSLYVEDVKVFIPLINRTISTNAYDNEMRTEEVQSLRNFPNLSNSPFILFQNRLLFSEIYPNPIYQSEYLTFALEVELSQPRIQASLRQIMTESKGGAIIFHSGQMWFVEDGSEPGLVGNFKGFLENEWSEGRMMGQGRVTIGNLSYLITYEQSPTLETTLLVYVPEANILGPVNKYRRWFWILSGLSIVIVVLFSFWIYRLIHRPLSRLVRVFRKVEQGDLSVSIHHAHEDEFHYLYEQFNFMVNRLQSLIFEVYEQKIRSQNSELRQLQSQINPHFLYNSYFVLFHMAEMHDIDNVKRMTKHLGEYFQFITRNASDDVRLEREVDHVKAYAEIQAIRFANRIAVEWGELPDCREMQVPRLMLQPIVENAYEHGLEDKVSDGRLRITFMLKGGELCIAVEDNGNHLTEEKLDWMRQMLASENPAMETTGMINVHRRLQIKFGSSYGLRLDRSTLGGLRTELHIPDKEGE